MLVLDLRRSPGRKILRTARGLGHPPPRDDEGDTALTGKLEMVLACQPASGHPPQTPVALTLDLPPAAPNVWQPVRVEMPANTPGSPVWTVRFRLQAATGRQLDVDDVRLIGRQPGGKG